MAPNTTTGSTGRILSALVIFGLGSWNAVSFAASRAPYPSSQTITAMSWDLAHVASLRKANGSDIWPMTWAADGNLYGAWGDGGGFDGNANSIGRVSLGFARITGTPAIGDPKSFAGQNVWGSAPQYAQYPASFGGKIEDLISIDGVLYGHGGLWTRANCGCADPSQRSGGNPTERTLTWSSDLGKTWTIAPWTMPSDLGATLQFGPDYRGAWDPAHLYLYYQRNVKLDATHFYLRRVRRDAVTQDPTRSGHYEYWMGGDPAAPVWSTVEENAVPVFDDPNIPMGTYAGQSVVYDPALGRYLLTAFHGNATGQIGFFEAPHPWGPWATIAYYADWGGFNETAGEGNGLSFPSKWISANGEGLWAVFSGVANGFDSFNLAHVTLSASANIPRIVGPAADASLTPGETVIAQGAGSALSWSVDVLGDGNAPIANGTGPTIRFLVPSNASSKELIRLTLQGSGGTIYRDYPISAATSMPMVQLDWVASGNSYAVSAARVGTRAYMDRTYALTALSPALSGARLIQTANDDKYETVNDALQFTVDREATVYVCYSEAATVLPAWLTSDRWTLTSESCDLSDGGSPARRVYRRSVNSGTVSLGGNRASPAHGPANYSNYVVIVAP